VELFLDDLGLPDKGGAGGIAASAAGFALAGMRLFLLNFKGFIIENLLRHFNAFPSLACE